MEYKTRLYAHVIVGYSMHKIQAGALFFTFTAQLLNADVGDPSRPPYLHVFKAITATSW